MIEAAIYLALMTIPVLGIMGLAIWTHFYWKDRR